MLIEASKEADKTGHGNPLNSSIHTSKEVDPKRYKCSEEVKLCVDQLADDFCEVEDQNEVN